MVNSSKTSRHPESTFSDTALKTLRSTNPKIWVFLLLWKAVLLLATDIWKPCLYLVHNSLSLDPHCSSLNQNIFITAMCLIHRILAAWRNATRFGNTVACVLASGVKTREVNPISGTSHSFKSTLPSSPALSLMGPALVLPLPPTVICMASRRPLPTLDLMRALAIIHFSLIPTRIYGTLTVHQDLC